MEGVPRVYSSTEMEIEMEEKELLRRDVCDLIEESAIECTHNISQNLVQAATTPKAHSCVQGVVERRFHPVHIRDFYSVINVLLLQMLTLRQRLYGDTRCEESSSKASYNDKALQRKVSLLEQEVKDNRKRYKELFKINQQWAKDYTELNRKLEQNVQEPSATPPLTSCSQCIQYLNELDSKTSLVKDLSLNYDKLKLIQSGLETRLGDSEQEKEKVKDEYKALSLQLQEVGGIARAVRYKEERTELIDEIRRLREKVTVLERERASLQTQLNKFRYSLRELMVESDSRSSGFQLPHPSSGFVRPSNFAKSPQVFTDSSGNIRSSGVRSNGSGYVVNPSQFAPLSKPRPLPTGYQDYNTPQTPPGYLSRGDVFGEDDESADEYITEETGKTKKNAPKYLNLPSYGSNGTLPSPLSVPRPLSAPGSLLDSTQQMTQIHKATLHSPDEEVLRNGLTTYFPQTNHHHSHHASNPALGFSNKLNGFETNHFKCPHCGAKFLQTQGNYAAWFDHVAECTSS